tara:strand:+ start:178 stop:1467 length:1290 start_codon:yes stop_codon:yes gene_type:complete
MRRGFLNKRGQTAAPTAEAKPGFFKKLFSKKEETGTNTGGAKPSVGAGKIIMLLVVLLLLPIVGLYGFNYASSTQGQVMKENALNFISENNPFTLYAELVGEAGSTDSWGVTTNSSSRKKGVDLNGIESISGDAIPASVEYFLVEYDIDYTDIGTDGVEAEFFCQLLDGDTVIVDGEIVPSMEVVLERGTDVFCRFNNADIVELDGTYTIKGWFTFPYETADVTQKVYFIKDAAADALEDQGKEFFSAYGIDKDSIKSYYNGEPVSVAIEEDDQPVNLREGSLPTLGLQLENEWNGEVVELLSMTLYLPSQITIDQEAMATPSIECPFIYTGEQLRKQVYILDSGNKEDVLNVAFFWGATIEEKKFSCWLEFEEDITGDADYIDLDYEVDLSYLYKTRERTTAIEIKGIGDAPVADYAMLDEEDQPISW